MKNQDKKFVMISAYLFIFNTALVVVFSDIANDHPLFRTVLLGVGWMLFVAVMFSVCIRYVRSDEPSLVERKTTMITKTSFMFAYTAPLIIGMVVAYINGDIHLYALGTALLLSTVLFIHQNTKTV